MSPARVNRWTTLPHQPHDGHANDDDEHGEDRSGDPVAQGVGNSHADSRRLVAVRPA